VTSDGTAIGTSDRFTASRRRQLLADGALVGVTFVWGTSFVLVKDVIEQVTPMVWLTMRFTLGALALALIALFMGRLRGLTWREVRWGALIGCFLWAGYALQTLGLQLTSASNGGFITGLSVVMVPIFSLLILKQKTNRWAMVGVGLATVGLVLFSLRIEQGVHINRGDVLVFTCAIAFALQIVTVSHVAGWADPIRITLLQVLFAGVLNGACALLFEGPVANISPEIWASAAYLGVVSTSLAILVQVSVQRFTTAVHTALIFALEPVFATAFGVWLQGDTFGPAELAGAMLILGGMLVAELGSES